MRTGYDIYLMAGQSNMVGQGVSADGLQDFNDPRVFQFGGAAKDPRYRTIFLGNDPAHHEEGVNNKKVSPIFPFGRAMALKTDSSRRILLVPVAHSGTALVNSLWGVGGKLYENAITQANLAIQAAKAYAEKKGYEINDDDSFRQIGMGPRKPSEGKTNKFSIELSKDGKIQ